jgi:FixJ family two-component response regulator
MHWYVGSARLAPYESAEALVTRPPVISIVDDDDEVRAATAGFVRALGYQARAYASAEAFLDSAGADEADCLILDVQMPGMSGPELQQALLQSAALTPIVFMTAYSDARVRAEVLAAGAVDVLAKPCDGKTLVDSIEAALASRR